MLNNTRGREIDNPDLNEILHNLRLLAYDADDVLDTLDYFRIQDSLDGTYHATNEHAGGCVHGLLFHARHTAKAVAAKLKPSSSTRDTVHAGPDEQDNSSQASPMNQNGQKINAKFMQKLACFTRSSSRGVGNGREVQTMQIPKLKFDRVAVSTKMTDIIEKLKPICAMISTILNMELLGSKTIATTTRERPITSEDITEPRLYGREIELQRVVDCITHGEYSTNEITVLPIVGPGGIGKTTFAQHLYNKVKSHFQVTIWICVSLNFNANRLAQEASKKMPLGGFTKENGSVQEKIEQRLKGKRVLLVLDDIWQCHEDEWEKLLAPFRKGGGKGSMVIVTTRMSDVAKMVKTVDSQIELDHLGDKDFRGFFDSCVSTKQESWSEQLELIEIGEEIVKKLKGSPLAAKTVGRVLRKEFTLEHWRRVLDCKEWELQTSENDIMPALQISYDYLPLDLKQCFSYCGLFPEDYEFDSKELIKFWVGLGVLSPGDQSTRMEDVGQTCITNLVNYGFFKMYERDNGQHYYVIHDLLHELAVKVSKSDCISIKVSEVRYIHIPSSVRHLSIIVDNKGFEDKITYKTSEEDLCSLDKRLQVENLRTLMFFGENVESFSKVFGNIFQQARALRTIFFSQASYNVEVMLHNISNLIHLRCLRIKGQCYYTEINLPATISRLYHLKILDMEDCRGCSIPSTHLSNLISMQYFIVPNNNCHSEIFNVGKMKHLRELRRFEVKKEDNGFELKELGQLQELQILGIYNLQKAKTQEEANEVKLIQKKYLQELILDWDTDPSDKDPVLQDNILENLRPHKNLCKISIKGHGGASCPSWLGENLSVRTLESLQLCDVSWTNFPPLGELWLVDQHGAICRNHTPGQCFTNLKKIELVQISKLTKWVGNGPSELFSQLKVLTIKDCPELMELPISQCGGYDQVDEPNMSWFPKLEELEITGCPKLSTLPRIPWSSTTCSATISQAGSGIERLSLSEYFNSQYIMNIEGKDALDSCFWRVLAFDNLSKLGALTMRGCPPLSLVHLEQLLSLKVLQIIDSSDAIYVSEHDGHLGYQFPAEYITIEQCGVNGKQLTFLLSFFPKLNSFTLGNCEKITGFCLVDKQKRTEEHKVPSSSSVNVVEEAQIVPHKQEQDAGGEMEIAAAAAEGLFLLPPHLLDLKIFNCCNLIARPNSHNHEGGDLQGVHFLRTLEIRECPRFLSLYSSSSSPCCPFPISLDYLHIHGPVGAVTLLPLSNLAYLTSLSIEGCGDLRGEGLWPLITEGSLKQIIVNGTPNFFDCSMPSLPSLQSKLVSLYSDDIPKVLSVPICALISLSLIELNIVDDNKVECFTKEQEEALQLLTSLEMISFQYCNKIQGLPAGLNRLPNLKILTIFQCAAIRSLPKDGLPSTLQELDIHGCPAIRSLPKDCLPSYLKKLVIRSCPAIRTLPKVEDLPSSLHELDVQGSESKELRRQCRKFIGSIPIVRA